MKPIRIALLLLLFVPLFAVAQKKPKKPAIPAAFGQAHYAYVEATDGGEFDRGLNPADRVAIADVRDAIKAWGRYVITPERNQAEIIFVVRKGRLAEVGINGGIGNAQDSQIPPIGQPNSQNQNRRPQPGAELGVGGGVGPADDLLQVCLYNTNDGKRSSPLWFQSEPGGLDAPRVRLLVRFKDAVEKEYPAPPPASRTAAPARP